MLRAFVLCASLASAGTAFATTGGPTEIDVLGYDENDHKITPWYEQACIRPRAPKPRRTRKLLSTPM
jgi:hypothetical protein